MKTVLDQCTPGQVVVAHARSYLTAEGVNKNYSEYGIVDNTKLQDILETDNQLFEMMMADRRIKVCFDIDAKGAKSEDPLNKVKNKIVSWFPNASMNIAGSRTKREADMWKFSYHIVLQNYHVENVNGFAPVKQLCMLPENKELGFDPAVYRTNGLFKFVNQSKGDGRVQKIFRGSKEIMDHTILHNIHDESISVESMNFDRHLDTLTKKRKASNENTKDKKKPRLAPREDIPRMNLQPPEELDIYSGDPSHLLTHMPNLKRGAKFQLSNWLCCKIARWCKAVGISFNDFWTWNLRKDSADSRLAKYREYWNRIDAVKFPVPETFLKGCLMSVYNSDILKSAPGKKMEKAVNTQFDHLIHSRWLAGKDLYMAGNAKHIVLHVPLGGNKSGSPIEYMNEIFKTDPRVAALWLTCRVALTNEQRGRLGEKWKYYLDYSVEEKRTAVHEPRLLCSVQSMYLVEGNYDFVVIDECETLLRSFAADAICHKNPSEHWNRLLDILRNAKKVVWMDGFLTTATTNLIRGLGEIPFIIGSNVKPNLRVIKYCENTEDLYYKIYESLDAGEKVFIASGAKGKKNVRMTPEHSAMFVPVVWKCWSAVV
ncbi:hypothetical protein HKX48_007567 [Thoreauomyces humboldtii]|nr:hypothetical protein HKX48_007567 [Thoreauomyces humboldtii]